MIYQTLCESVRRSASVILLSIAVLVSSILSAYADEDRSRVQRFDIADVLDTLAEELARGLQNSQIAVEALDAASKDRLEEMLTVEDYKHVGFSARTQITAMYNLAEANSADEGSRFIAKLHRQVALSSLIVQNDAGLQSFSMQFSTSELDKPIQYAALDTLAPRDLLKPLPPNVEAAVRLLSNAIAPTDLGNVVTLMERHLRLESRGEPASRVIDKAVLSSTSTKEVLARILNAHTPPPKTSTSMRNLLLDVASKNATLNLNPELAGTLRVLSEEPLPREVAKLTELADTLPSRIAQEGASSAGTAISKPLEDAQIASKLNEIIAQGGVEALANNGGGAGGGGPSYQSNRNAHAEYGRRTHSGPNPVSRTFSRAIRSSRAARGVAVGAEVVLPTQVPSVAYWIPSKQDNAFGRLAVQISESERIAISRFLFADSFEAALSTLHRDHGEEARFNDGDITIVMSMDPESDIAKNDRERIISNVETKLEALSVRTALASESEQLNLMMEALELQVQVSEQLAQLPRGIVIHPALHSRELAWSVARVDFWFNDIERLNSEASKIGANQLPSHLKSVFSGNAGTWQFYERASEIRILSSGSSSDKIEVNSNNGGHFAVSLFAFGEERPSGAAQRDNDGVWRLLGEERQIQPMLDWALRNHHDFIRLNDYSEALSLIRWLDSKGTTIHLLDPDGEGQRVSTPDRVLVGEVGPQAGG